MRGKIKGRPRLKRQINFMKFDFYLQELNEEWIGRIKEVLRYDLADEIEEAVDSGMEKETAEEEIIDNYLNTHNFRQTIEL